MSQYPPARHPADNESLRPLYHTPIQTMLTGVKYPDGRPHSIWVLRNTPENLARYYDLFESNNPPRTQADALEQAGATFFPVWYHSETIRVFGGGPKALEMAFYRIPRTAENLRLAEEELDQNVFEFTEDRIAEERKTLEWVRQQMEKESQPQEREADQAEEVLLDAHSQQNPRKDTSAELSGLSFGHAKTLPIDSLQAYAVHYRPSAILLSKL